MNRLDMAGPVQQPKAKTLFAAAGVVIAWAVLSFGVMRLPSDTWFEDDPNVVAYTTSHPEPWRFLADPATIQALHGQRVLTPMQPFSFWLDGVLAPQNAAFAYVHSSLWLLATMLAGFWALRHWLETWGAAAAMMTWACLPATMAVTEFLSARHYLAGMCFFLLALGAVRKRAQSVGWRRALWLTVCLSGYVASLCSKELYWLAGWWVLGTVAMADRDIPTMVAVGGLGLCYPIYRFWALDTLSSGVAAPDVALSSLPAFLLQFPNYFAGLGVGWIWLGITFVLMWRCWRERAMERSELWLWLGFVATAIAVVVPVLPPLLAPNASLTWTRVLLLWNGVWLAVTWRLLVLVPLRSYGWFLAFLGMLVAVQAWQTAAAWDRLKQPYAEHAAFYRDYPDRLLLVQLPGEMFMPGIHRLLRADVPRHFLDDRQTGPAALAMLNRYQRLWTIADNGREAAAERHARAWYNATHAKASLSLALPRDVALPMPVKEPVVRFQGPHVRWQPHRYAGLSNVTTAAVTERARQVFILPEGWTHEVQIMGDRPMQGTVTRAAWRDQPSATANIQGTHANQQLGLPMPLRLTAANSLTLRTDQLQRAVVIGRSKSGQVRVFEPWPMMPVGTALSVPHLPKDHESWDFGLLIFNDGESSAELSCVWTDSKGQWAFDEDTVVHPNGLVQRRLNGSIPADDAFGMLFARQPHLYVMFYLAESGWPATAWAAPVQLIEPNQIMSVPLPQGHDPLLVVRHLGIEPTEISLIGARHTWTQTLTPRQAVIWPSLTPPLQLQADQDMAAWWFYRATWGDWQLRPVP